MCHVLVPYHHNHKLILIDELAGNYGLHALHKMGDQHYALNATRLCLRIPLVPWLGPDPHTLYNFSTEYKYFVR